MFNIVDNNLCISKLLNELFKEILKNWKNILKCDIISVIK